MCSRGIKEQLEKVAQELLCAFEMSDAGNPLGADDVDFLTEQLYRMCERKGVIDAFESFCFDYAAEHEDHSECYSYEDACEMGEEAFLDKLRDGDTDAIEQVREIIDLGVPCGECGTGDLEYNRALDCFRCNVCAREIARNARNAEGAGYAVQ